MTPERLARFVAARIRGDNPFEEGDRVRWVIPNDHVNFGKIYTVRSVYKHSLLVTNNGRDKLYYSFRFELVDDQSN